MCYTKNWYGVRIRLQNILFREPEIIGGAKALYWHVDYTVEARRIGVEGKLIVAFKVDEFGYTSDFEVLQEPDGGLGRSVINAIRNVKFKPAI